MLKAKGENKYNTGFSVSGFAVTGFAVTDFSVPGELQVFQLIQLQNFSVTGFSATGLSVDVLKPKAKTNIIAWLSSWILVASEPRINFANCLVQSNI